MTDVHPSEPAEYQLIGPSEDGKIGDLLGGQKPKEARQRLQALISEWLRMENLVVLTGAGTSKSSGGKLMADLEDCVLETARNVQGIPATAAAIIDQRRAPQTEDYRKIGFEDWLSYLVNANHLAHAPDSPFADVRWKGGNIATADDLDWLVIRIGRAIFLYCGLRLETGQDAGAPPPHLAFLAKLLARDSNLGRAHLFTLNYDTLFEQALETLGIQYFDGFTGRADARFDPSVYGLDVYWPGEVTEGRVRRFDKFLHLYKLHGSIHWQIRDGELRARHTDLAPFEQVRALAPALRAAELESQTQHVNPIGILPTANKFVQTLTMPFAQIFRAFQIRLSVPQTFLLVLGYGFGDDHVTRLIETALMNPSLIMLVVEPDPNSPTIQRIRRYKELGKRAFVLTASEAAHAAAPFKRATFDDFGNNVMPDVQWLEDFLRLRRFEKQIAASTGSDPSAEA
jgi:SIR2-like domain